MKYMVTAFLMCTFFCSKGQAVKDSFLLSLGDPYPKMYDYASMGDTLIRDVGNNPTATGFKPANGTQMLCCSAERIIRVKSGKLREVVISDTGTGMITKRKYKKGKLVKENRRFDVKIVRNVPPYHSTKL